MTDWTDWSRKDGGVFFLTETGFRQTPGWSVIAEFGAPVDELKVRRGRLTAKVDGVWHIVPTGALEGKK